MPIRSLLMLLMVALLGGCFNTPSIRFHAATTVEMDGSMQRTVSYRTDLADSESAMPLDELKSEYTLPANGEWGEYARNAYEKNGEVRERVSYKYTTTTHFPAGSILSPDFRRHGHLRENIASNDIRIAANHYGFWTSFEYEETFTDVVTAKGFSAAFEEYYLFLTETIGGVIDAIPNSGFENAAATIRRNFDAEFEDLIELFIAACIGSDTTTERCTDELENSELVEKFIDLIDDEDELIQLFVKMFPAPENYNAEDWPNIFGELLEEIDCEDCIVWPTHLFDGLFGVHGFLMFKSYRFEVNLSMPGDMISNNADSRDGSILMWEFRSSEFEYRAHRLIAESRMIYWNRIFAAFLIMLICALWLRTQAGQAGSDASS